MSDDRPTPKTRRTQRPARTNPVMVLDADDDEVEEVEATAILDDADTDDGVEDLPASVDEESLDRAVGDGEDVDDAADDAADDGADDAAGRKTASRGRVRVVAKGPEDADAATPSKATAGGSIGRARLPWIIAGLFAATTVAFAVLWLSVDRDAGAHRTKENAEVEAAATTFAQTLTNFDGATIDRDFDRLVGISTGDFRKQAASFFSDEVRGKLREAQASSRGEVSSVHVEELDGDRASAFVVVDQTIANNRSPQPSSDTVRMQLEMTKTDGAWLVSSLSILDAPTSGGAVTSGTTAGTSGAATADPATPSTTAGG